MSGSEYEPTLEQLHLHLTKIEDLLAKSGGADPLQPGGAPGQGQCGCGCNSCMLCMLCGLGADGGAANGTITIEWTYTLDPAGKSKKGVIK
jgi:hypothetical protein